MNIFSSDGVVSSDDRGTKSVSMTGLYSYYYDGIGTYFKDFVCYCHQGNSYVRLDKNQKRN